MKELRRKSQEQGSLPDYANFDLAFWKEIYKEGKEAGAKEGGVIWHDLRKNPDDLPKEVGHYIVCYLDTACERHTFELSFVDYFEDKHWIDEDNHNIEGYDEGVIVWGEIPRYTEEEVG